MAGPGSSTADTGKSAPRWILKTATRLHVLLHRLSDGQHFNSVGGDDVCFVTMKRAKSGRTLTIPLMYVPYRAGVLLVASQGGAPKNPAWYFNLAKHPDIKVSHRNHHMKLRARIATSDEKPTLWPICDQCYAPYADYRMRTSRGIPIFVCEPANNTG
jgi:deazaflavin-dependent oxidoreductase (nitroreductase family)